MFFAWFSWSLVKSLRIKPKPFECLALFSLAPQEFKGSYRAWNTRPPMPPIHRGMLAADGGLVPLPNGDWRVMALDPNAPPPAVRGEIPLLLLGIAVKIGSVDIYGRR